MIKITQRDRRNLALLSLALVDTKSIELSMESFATQKVDESIKKFITTLGPKDVQDECGTTCCFLGHASFVDHPDFKQAIECAMDQSRPSFCFNEWIGLSKELFSFSVEDDIIWDFLFCGKWPNDKNLCLHRAQIIIGNEARELSVEEEEFIERIYDRANFKTIESKDISLSLTEYQKRKPREWFEEIAKLEV